MPYIFTARVTREDLPHNRRSPCIELSIIYYLYYISIQLYILHYYIIVYIFFNSLNLYIIIVMI